MCINVYIYVCVCVFTRARARVCVRVRTRGRVYMCAYFSILSILLLLRTGLSLMVLNYLDNINKGIQAENELYRS